MSSLVKVFFVFIVLLCSGCSLSYYNVNQAGVYGDGTHDDWKTLQTLLSRGGKFYFPAGRYLISNTLHVNQSNTHMKLHKNAIIECNSATYGIDGLGNAGATIAFNHPNYTTEPGDYIYNVGIRGGHIRNTSPLLSHIPNNENAIGFSHCDGFYCKNVTIDYCNRKGITAQYYNKNGVIENCEIHSCGLHGITIETESNNIVVKNNVIKLDSLSFAAGENTNGGMHYGIHVTTCKNISVENNHIIIDQGNCIYSHLVDTLSIVNNNVVTKDDYSNSYGIYAGVCNKVTVASNLVNSCARGVLIGVSINNFAYVENNTITSRRGSLYLYGEGKSKFIARNNIMTSDVSVREAIVIFKNNIAQACNIHKPYLSPQLYSNKFCYLNVMNATDTTRAITIGNKYIEDYKNWRPIVYDDIIDGREVNSK